MWTHHVVFKYELYLNDSFLVYVLSDSGTGNIETVNEVMCVCDMNFFFKLRSLHGWIYGHLSHDLMFIYKENTREIF